MSHASSEETVGNLLADEVIEIEEWLAQNRLPSEQASVLLRVPNEELELTAGTYRDYTETLIAESQHYYFAFIERKVQSIIRVAGIEIPNTVDYVYEVEGRIKPNLVADSAMAEVLGQNGEFDIEYTPMPHRLKPLLISKK